MTIAKILLKRAKTEGTPLIDGNKAIFIWETKKGQPVPYLVGDFNGWGWNPDKEAKLTEAVKGIWTHTLTLPRDAYLEYFYTTDHTDPDARLNDPLSKQRITNGMGKFNNYFRMPDAPSTQLHKAARGIPQGKITKHEIKHDLLLMKGKRKVWLYAPPVDQAVPLLLVYDGKDYLKRAKLPQIVDNLIAQGKIEPVALAMVQHAERGRFTEYNASEACLLMVTELILPLAKKHLNLIDVEQQPGAYGVLGASMGGLMALYTALRLPAIFGKVLSQSGAFQFDLGEYEAVLKVLLRTLPPPALTIWQDVGQLEWLVDTNRQLNTLLQERGYNVTYREYAGAHNFTSWQNMLPDALLTTFGKSIIDQG